MSINKKGKRDIDFRFSALAQNDQRNFEKVLFP